MIQTNVLPSFSENVYNNTAILPRIVIIPFIYTFGTASDVTSNPKKYRLINENLKTIFATPQIRTCFVYMLMKQYPLYLQTSADGSLKKYFQEHCSLLTYHLQRAPTIAVSTAPVDTSSIHVDVCKAMEAMSMGDDDL